MSLVHSSSYRENAKLLLMAGGVAERSWCLRSQIVELPPGPNGSSRASTEVFHVENMTFHKPKIELSLNY
jgi:hypothetical protein